MDTNTIFFERCRQIFERVRGDVPEIAAQLKPKKCLPGKEGLWCSIFGENDNSAYPKFWEEHVSTYFIAKALHRDDDWKIGIHFCPSHKVRWRGDVYGADVIAMLRRHDGKGSFRFVHKPGGTEDFRIEVNLRITDLQCDDIVRSNLSWLLKNTWPDIQSIINSHRY